MLLVIIKKNLKTDIRSAENLTYLIPHINFTGQYYIVCIRIVRKEENYSFVMREMPLGLICM